MINPNDGLTIKEYGTAIKETSPWQKIQKKHQEKMLKERKDARAQKLSTHDIDRKDKKYKEFSKVVDTVQLGTVGARSNVAKALICGLSTICME